jgi:hypothetical protein
LLAELSPVAAAEIELVVASVELLLRLDAFLLVFSILRLLE